MEVREYLVRHRIHKTFEDCVQALVMEQPASQELVTETLIHHLTSLQQSLESPPKKVIFVLGKDSVAIAAHIKQFLASQSTGGYSLISAARAPAKEVQLQVMAASSEVVFVMDFPKTIQHAISFESCYGYPFVALLFSEPDDYKNMEFLKSVNPVAAYYAAKKKLRELDCRSSDPGKIAGTLQST